VTPSSHKPVLLGEVLAALQPRAGGRYADGTVGMGGHAEAILSASRPTGWLFGCDLDGAALEVAAGRLSPFAGRFELRRGNFAELVGWIGDESCDGVLLDLGVSSPQLDVAERGFSFQQDGPLDMRMNRDQELTAGDLVNSASVQELTGIFRDYGDEPEARRFARAIEQERQATPIRRTLQLADLISRLSPRAGRRTHPATRVFQALRIAVNDELDSLQRGLEAGLDVLKPGGRLAVVSFHSAEDRVVKEFGRTLARDYEVSGDVDDPLLRRPRAPRLSILTRKAIQPSAEEIAENPRARSAQLRIFEKTTYGGK
jgi:16S rRNA (cytosine1402-N4)-methyltransferase